MTFTTSSALVGHLVAVLAERRRALKLVQIEVDAKLGWADGLTAKYEAGMRAPTIQALTWWAEALGMKITLGERGGTRLMKRAIIRVHLEAGFTQRQIKAVTGASEHTISSVLRESKLHRPRGRRSKRLAKSKDATCISALCSAAPSNSCDGEA